MATATPQMPRPSTVEIRNLRPRFSLVPSLPWLHQVAHSSEIKFSAAHLPAAMAEVECPEPADCNDWLGPYCKEIGVSEKQVKAALANESAIDEIRRSGQLTNGVVWEFCEYRRRNSLSVEAVVRLCCAVAGVDRSVVNNKAAGSKIERMKVQRGKLVKAKSSADKFLTLMSQPFELPLKSSELECCALSAEQTTSSFVKDFEKQLSEEVVESQAELVAEQARNQKLQSSLDSMRKKVKNVRKVLGRREKKIREDEDLREKVKELDESFSDLSGDFELKQSELDDTKRRLRNERERMYYHRRSRASTSSSTDCAAELGEAYAELEQYKCRLSELELMLEDTGSTVFHGKSGGVFKDAVRTCCLELLSLNVGILNVRPVIESVLRMVDMSATDLPSTGTLSTMLLELKRVSMLHIAEEVQKADNLTLHSDGTSKFGKKYGSYQVATNSQVFSLGVVDMKCGTAAHTLEKLKEVLSDVSDVCSAASLPGDVGLQIVGKLKNTMSDRCAVQKSFNELLLDYRAEVLPNVIEGWESLSDDAQQSMLRMNNFFCGMHLIVGFATQAVKALAEWEKEFFQGRKVGANTVPGVYEKKESLVQRLIRTATSTFEKHGNEQAGAVASFQAYLAKEDMHLDLHDLRGNREYILFYNAAGIYAVHECMLFFLLEVQGETNLLLRAVSADLSVPELVAGARALALLCKLVITPLWRVLEDRFVSILDMSSVYTSLCEKFFGVVWGCFSTIGWVRPAISGSNCSRT